MGMRHETYRKTEQRDDWDGRVLFRHPSPACLRLCVSLCAVLVSRLSFSPPLSVSVVAPSERVAEQQTTAEYTSSTHPWYQLIVCLIILGCG